MTVGVDAELRIREYPGDDSATPRAYGFRILDEDDLRVTRTNADGSETVLVRGTDYTVSGAGNPTGGNVTPLAPIATGTSWRIEGNMALGQPTDYTAGDDFPAESHELGLDRSMIAHQEARRDLNDLTARSWIVPRDEVGGVLPKAAERAGKFRAWDAGGQEVTASGLGADGGLREDLAEEFGADLSGFRQNTGNDIAYKLADRLRETVSGLAYLTPEQKADAAGGAPVLDISSKVQTAVNENKGKRIIWPKGYVYHFADIVLDGATYDGTELVFEGEVLMRARVAATPGFPFYAAVVCRGVSRFSVTMLDVHGNRANQPAIQQIFCIAVISGQDFAIPVCAAREMRGDAVYLGKDAALANSRGARLGRISAVNSADDGRNVLSIISCDDGTLESLYGYQVGGTIGGVNMPGGLDIEPNLGTESVRNWSFGPIVTYSKGNCGGFQILGKAATNDAARDWNVGNLTFASVTVRRKPGLGGSANILRCADVTIAAANLTSDSDGTEANTAAGWVVDFADRITGDFSVSTASTGLQIGVSNTVNDALITVHINNYFSSGVVIGNVNHSTIRGKVRNANAAGGNRFGLRLLQGARTFENIGLTLSVDIPYDGVAARGIMQTAAAGVLTLTRCAVKDCDLSGWALNTQIDLNSVYLPSENVKGRNIRTALTAAPAIGRWAAGDEVVLDQVAGATAPRVKCITQGAPGTWKAYAVMAA